jgi:hypothetical protein
MSLRRGNSGVSSSDTPEIISSEEQQKLIDDLKQQASSQTKTFRFYFYLLFLFIAGLFLVGFVCMTYYPWQLDHQRHFQSLIPVWAFQIYYLFSAYCFYVAAQLVNVRNSKIDFILVYYYFCFCLTSSES